MQTPADDHRSSHAPDLMSRTLIAALLLLLAACGTDAEPGAGGPDRGADTGTESDVAPSEDTESGPDADDDTDGVDAADDVTSCMPLSLRCDGATGRLQCNDAGTGWTPIDACTDGELCVSGTCLNACEIPGKFTGSTVACEFWSVDLGQWHVRPGEPSLDPSASGIPHAVLIGNPGERPATISFEVADGTDVPVDDPIVPAGGARSFLMPVLSQQDSGVTAQSIHVRSTQPVIAAQINTASNAPGFALHTTDASLLYPIDLLGTYHVALAQHGTDPGAGMTKPLGYITVVAVEPGETTVSINPTADTLAGPEFPAYSAGERIQQTLQQGEILTLYAVPRSLFATSGGDLSGTSVTSTQRVAFFTGHDCQNVIAGNCDHLESQLLPVERWGSTYVSAPFQTPSRASLVRVVAAEPNTVISTSPSIPGLDGQTLGARAWVEVQTDRAFALDASAPVAITQYMGGSEVDGAIFVDPSMTALIPVTQYRDSYPMLVPEGFAVNRVAIVRPAGRGIRLNGTVVSASFQAIGDGTWELGDVEVGEGVQVLDGDAPFGAVLYGFDNKVSYALPAGLGAGE
jgi:hypothetical protein